MIDFLGYRKTFCEKIKWCDAQIEVVSLLRTKRKDLVLLKLLEYKKDCQICCRRIDIFNNKYNNFKNIPDEIYREAKDLFLKIIFSKYERTMASISSLKYP